MNIVCTRENLSQALALVSGVAGKSVNLPILSNVLIRAEEQKVELVATNLELAVVAQLRAKVEQAGAFTVPAKTLYDFVNLLSEEKVELAVKDSELEVACGKSATKIKGSPADEFPVVPAAEGGKGYLVDTTDFKRGLEQVTQAAAKNDIRPELAGVFLDFNNVAEGKLVVAATDSYRLAEKKLDLVQGLEKTKAIVPARTAQEINRVLSLLKGSEAEKSVRILVAENQIILRCNEVELMSRLVEGQYPDYQQIIPDKTNTTAEFSVAQASKEVKAASLFTTTGVNAVAFSLDPKSGAVGVSSVSAQTGEHQSEVSADISGEENSILLNHRYVLDGLSHMETDSCQLKVVNGDSPCVFLPKGDESYLYIVMPIRQ